jgi:hypothetical protein
VAANCKVREEIQCVRLSDTPWLVRLFSSCRRKRDETLKYRFVQHATFNQNQQVGDVDRHVMGVSRLVGIVFFPDGSIAGTDVVVATYDSTPPNGTTNGYGITTFADGSELWASFTGTIKFGNPTTERGTTTVIGGKGRYAGAKGDGTWEAVVTRGPESIQVIDNVLNIKK